MRVSLAAVLLLSAQEVTQAELREGLRDDALEGAWVYGDLDAGLAEARKSGKPVLVLARCVP
jgi:hypothetical protein